MPLPHDPFGAFCPHGDIQLEPTGSGPLDGLTFAAKDLFDLAGHVTGCGSPQWLESHEAATQTAPAITRLLAAGARLVGKTNTDEMAFSLNGINPHYGTPVNPAAPTRIPGGSSSGSAAAVAGELVDFAIGTDTAGSVRVPASYCGLYGFRPTHGRVPLDHTFGLAQSYDTVGWFARTPELLAQVGRVLLADDGVPTQAKGMVLAQDLFQLPLPPAQMVLPDMVEAVMEVLGRPELIQLCDMGSNHWRDLFRFTQADEVWAAHGDWYQAVQPDFSAPVKERFEWATTLNPQKLNKAKQLKPQFAQKLKTLLSDGVVMILPTVPGPAPLLTATEEELNSWRNRVITLTCAAGIGGLPQVHLPLGSVQGAPYGVSLVAGPGEDLMLLDLAARVRKL